MCMREDGQQGQEGIDWRNAGTVTRWKDCKEICGDDGECSGFDFNTPDGTCRLWVGELYEEVNEETNDENYKCGAKHYKPKDTAPQDEKDRHA